MRSSFARCVTRFLSFVGGLLRWCVPVVDLCVATFALAVPHGGTLAGGFRCPGSLSSRLRSSLTLSACSLGLFRLRRPSRLLSTRAAWSVGCAACPLVL
ncbi:hypothetical protein EV363DRAFT_1337989 [Boletus edulis]|nr:hypothetical protein EV363DRAFT_1337989 [Boletus edulis]